MGLLKRLSHGALYVVGDLRDQLGVAQEKIGVVYHGTDLNGNAPGMKPTCIPMDWIGRFVFTAGLIYPYRDLEDLVAAWDLLRGLPDLPVLVIAGKVGKGMGRYYERLPRLVQEKKLNSHIRFAGVLRPDEMVWCYEWHCRRTLHGS